MGKEVINNSTIQLIRRQLREKALAYAAQMDNDAAVQRAVEEVMEDMHRLDPQQDRLQETLDAIWERQKQEGAELDPPVLNGNADEQQRRLEYAQQCRKALFQALKASTMRSLVFQDTVKSYFKPGELMGEVSDHGWMQDLLWLISSQEDAQWYRRRNEGVVLMAAMCENAITPQLFADKYLSWLTEDSGSEEKALKTFGGELHSAPTALRKTFFDAVGEKDYTSSDVQSTYERFQRGELRGSQEKVDKAYAALVKYVAASVLHRHLNTMLAMSGSDQYNARNAVSKLIDDDVPQRGSAEELEEVYSRIVGQNGSFQVAQNYSLALNDLMEMGYVTSQENITENYPENEEREAAAAYYETVAAQCANPYYALITGEDLKNGKIMSFSYHDSQKKNLSYLDSYAKDQLRAEENKNAMLAAKEAKNFLSRIYLRGEVPVPLPCEDDEDLVMYRDRGRTLIFHTEAVTLANGTVATRYTDLCREPGLFIDRGLVRGVDELRQTSSELPWDLLAPLPQDVIRMNTALEALNGVTLGSKASPDNIRDLIEKLDEMKKAAEAYYEKHKAEWDDEALAGEDRKISEARLAFAGELITFAEKKTYLLNGIQEHMRAIGELGLYRQLEEKADLNEGRYIISNEEDGDDEDVKENDRSDSISSGSDDENEKGNLNENNTEYKKNLNIINEDKSIDPAEAEAVSTQMKELLQNARGNVNREAWAWGERTTGTDSKANKYLDMWIQENTQAYLKNKFSYNAKRALTVSTLKYMMNQEKGGELLEFALVHEGLEKMQTMIADSVSFQKRLAQLDLTAPKQVEECLKNPDLFTKPLGDKLLHMAESVLNEEAPLVEKQDRINTLKAVEDGSARRLQYSEEALENGDTKGAAEYGTEALALQTVANLLRLTVGKAGDPYAVQRKVHNSGIFKEELKKLDLSKPGAVKKALDAKFGSTVAGAIMRLSQKTGNDLGSNGNPPASKTMLNGKNAHNLTLPHD